MSTRAMTFSGTSDTSNLLIKPAEIRVATDGIYANAKYIGLTDETISVSVPKEYAEFLQSGSTAYNQVIKTDMQIKFALAEIGNIDQLALAMGIENIDTTIAGHERILIDSNNTSIPNNLYIINSEFVDGRSFEAVVWKGQVMNPEDLPMGASTGSTDYAGIGIEVKGIIDSTRAGNNLGYIDIALP